MLSIILVYKSNNEINDIKNYILHLNNIIHNITTKLQILIINCNSELNNLNIQNISQNIIIQIYNYSNLYEDSIYNDVINHTLYDKILFTDFNIYLTNIFLDWINNTTIPKKSFVKTNTFLLNNISPLFLHNFNNSIYNEISNNLNIIINESGMYNIDSETYIDIFNNNKNVYNINSELIKTNNLYFLHNSSDFLLINKDSIKNTGFVIDNTNINHTFQYITLKLIEDNFTMLKLPYCISVYKQYYDTIHDNFTHDILDHNVEFTTSLDFNKFNNLKIYNINDNKTSIHVRNQIKTIKGYNNIDMINENKRLKKNIEKLINNKNTDPELIKEKDKLIDILKNKLKIIEEQLEDIHQQYKCQLTKKDEEINILKQKNDNIKENILIKLYDIIHHDIDDN